MNKLFGNSYQMKERNGNMEGGFSMKGLSFQSESLYGMALYDFDTLAADVGLPSAGRNYVPPIFHPVDEYKDLSLKEILDLSDDFISGEDDHLLGSYNNDYCLEPTPFPNGLLASQVRPTMPSMIGSMDLNSTSHQEQLHVFNCEQQHQLLQQQLLENQLRENQLQQQQQQQQRDQQQPQRQWSECQQKPQLPMLKPVMATSGNFITNKRSRECLDDSDDEEQYSSTDDSPSSKDRRFRPYQAGQWSEKFEELCEYKDKMGHCLVPHTFNENLALARWVKRQRYQYKLMMENKSSTMTADRVKGLDEIGFVWDSQGAAWGDRLGELHHFRQTYMHCNVPSNFNDNPRLATWIKCQRRQYKLYMEGKPSNMTPQRTQHLENLGFEWELRTYKKQRQN